MEVPYGPIGNLVASAEVSAAGAIVGKTFGIAGAPTLLSSVYTFTLTNPIDLTNSIVHVCPVGTTAVYASGGQTGDTTLAISTFNAAGTPTNGAFQVHVFRRGTA